jgi:NADP-dependent aldehyde dehydrogenase
LVVAIEGESLQEFTDELVRLTDEYLPGSMLHSGIREAYEKAVVEVEAKPGVNVLARSKTLPDASKTEAAGLFLGTRAADFLADSDLAAEIFGPSTMLVTCRSRDEIFWLAKTLDGHLTSTLHADEEDLAEYADLVPILEEKVGRLILNGFPTGVEVCHAMHHGGPFPATTDVRETSVGTAAIKRFARPVCYQDFPDTALPVELQNGNARGIWRLINGEFTRDNVRRCYENEE